VHNHPTWQLVLAVVVLLAACTSAPTQAPTQTPAAPVKQVQPSPTPCALEPVIAPTRAPETPDYAELDPTTGLHMTGTAQLIDPETYRLEISGKVAQPLSLSYDDLRCLPKLETHCLLICPGFFQDEATWAGVPLSAILDQAQVQGDATGLWMTGADGYRSFVTLEQARAEESILAYEWEGEPLPILHGFPVRAVFPELNGNRWVKWLIEIEVE
jgi:DMSO/TMAO reductase YedYZ molybdopterin-dependent catalytic subunit